MDVFTIFKSSPDEGMIHLMTFHLLLPVATWVVLIFVAYREWRARHALQAELKERKLVEQSLQRRGRYLKALSEANQLLLTHPGYQESYEGILRMLGLAAGASRVYIFENHEGEKGKLLTSQRAEWCSPGILPQIDNNELRGIVFAESPSRRWLPLLQQGRPVTGRVTDLPPEERAFLESQQILSILILPMHVNGSFFGFIGFDQCDREREWDDPEIYLLKAAALTLSQHIERQLALDEVAYQRQQLESRVESRTEQLQLANEELEAFCYTVSHDLRGPLTGIRGFSQLLLEEMGTADRVERDYALRVLDITDRTLQMIDDLLELSRASRTELQRSSIDLSTIAHTIAAELQLQHPGRKASFQIQDGIVAEGDENLLRVVIHNLLSNAWKYTAKKPAAEIEVGSMQQGMETVYFVRDNGAGFRMAYVEKLFLAFSRLHTAHEFPGTGVGLATVRRIIQRHGGRVWADGEPDQGATFYFTVCQGEVGTG